MNHIWTVMQDGKRIGTVEAISRKGACHDAYQKFGITPDKQKTISVHRLTFGVESTPVTETDPETGREAHYIRHRFENPPTIGEVLDMAKGFHREQE